MPELQYWNAVRDALDEEMARDERVFIMGEDVCRWGQDGGVYGATRGLAKKYGSDRVRDTPLSEAGFVGAGIGAALTGMRPVVEVMYVDFLGLAMENILNQMSKVRYMFGGKAKVPIVLRTQQGAGKGLAAQHSQSLEALVCHIPGLKVVVPYTPADAKGLLKTAIRDDNPVIFLEHKWLYFTKGEVPDGEWLVPFGQASVRRQGRDLTIVAYQYQVYKALEASEILVREDGIEAEVIDLRTLVPLDVETIVNSVRKTHKLLITHEAVERGGMAGEIAMAVMNDVFDYLDAPIVRVCAGNVPIPYAENLEQAVLPQVEDILKQAREICPAHR